MTRRFFIGGMAASLGMLAGSKMFAQAGATGAGGHRMRLGVISDVHLNRPGDEDMFLRALEYFRDRGADGVLIAGDFADTGRYEQVKRLTDTWFKVFPNDKAPDGRHVERLFVYGNHCVTAWTWGNPYKDREDLARKEAIGYKDNRARFWDELFHEEFQPIWMKTVKGIPVIGAHWEERGAGNGIEAYMKANGAKLDPKVPFVYTQHDHPWHTCFGEWAWGHDDGRATRALSPFPKAVAFSGHSHYTLVDDRTVWQGAFTSINTASLRYPSADYSLRENINGNGFGYRGEKRAKRMPQIGPRACQGQLVSFWDDRLAIERRDFFYGESLGPDWVVPLPASENAPFAYARHAATRTAPEFDAGAKPTVTVAKPKNEKDFTHVDVTFPAAKAKDEACRVCEYEVTAVLVEDDVDLVQAQRRMMSPDHCLPVSKLVKDVTFTFAAEDLPMKGHYRFEVRALECFGKKGGKIASELVVI